MHGLLAEYAARSFGNDVEDCLDVNVHIGVDVITEEVNFAILLAEIAERNELCPLHALEAVVTGFLAIHPGLVADVVEASGLEEDTLLPDEEAILVQRYVSRSGNTVRVLVCAQSFCHRINQL